MLWSNQLLLILAPRPFQILSHGHKKILWLDSRDCEPIGFELLDPYLLIWDDVLGATRKFYLFKCVTDTKASREGFMYMYVPTVEPGSHLCKMIVSSKQSHAVLVSCTFYAYHILSKNSAC